MASEASRSVDSYIGSLISITTKSEIRYEGILQTINSEESSIGLINVKSYGTEGRRKDGQQVPPNDKVYEYILFRGSDIKDLLVKKAPVQATQPIYNDPAIIQSNYSHSPPVSTSLPSACGGSIANPSSQAAQVTVPTSSSEGGLPIYQPVQSLGSWASSASPSANGSCPAAGPTSHAAQLAVPRSTFEGGPALYQPGGSLGIWGSSPSLNTVGTGSGVSMPIYWQGFYGPSHVPQQSLFQPPFGMQQQHSMPQPTYPAISPAIHSGSSNLPTSNMSDLRELAPSLLPPFSIGSANSTSTTTQSALLSSQSSALASAVSPNVQSNTASTAVPSALSASHLSASQLTSSVAKTAPILPLSYQPIVETSRLTNSETSTPTLVTPSQLLQPGQATISPLLSSSDPATKDAQVVQPSQSTTSTTQAPILPLPSQQYQEFHGPFRGHQNHINRGRGRGWGDSISSSATRFTDDFDFMAMHEKFNKEEVWGDLGKQSNNNRRKITEDDNHDGDDIIVRSLEKCMYKKDEFFDSISRQPHYNGPRNNNGGRRNDSETFDEFPRHRGGRSRGRGYYGYVGRGQGYY